MSVSLRNVASFLFGFTVVGALGLGFGPSLLAESSSPEPVAVAVAAEGAWAVVGVEAAQLEIPEALDRLEVEIAEIDDGQRASLHVFASTAEVEDAVDRVHRAQGLEFGACVHPGCSVLTWLGIHRAATLRALDRGLRGERERAYELLRQLIALDHADLTATNTVIRALVGTANLQRALEVATFLLDHDQGEASAAQLALREAVAAAAVPEHTDRFMIARCVINFEFGRKILRVHEQRRERIAVLASAG